MQELRLQERQQQRRLLRGQESPPLAAFLQLLLRPAQAPASPQRRVRAARHRLELAAERGAGAASPRVRSWPSPAPETGTAAAAKRHRAPGPAGRHATIIRVGTRVPGFQVTVGYAAASRPERSRNPGGRAPDRTRRPILSSKKPDSPGADLRGSPESSKCPRGGGAASAALSAQAAQRGSTTFVAASLHRALTLGASSGEGSGRDNNTPLPPPPLRRRRPPGVAATHGGRLRSGLGLTTPGLGPRALCCPLGRPAGRGKAGATGLRLSAGAASVRGWAGVCFRGDRAGGGGAFLSLWRRVWALTFFSAASRGGEAPRFLRSPLPRGGFWCARQAPARSSPSLSAPRLEGGRRDLLLRP